MVERLQHAIAKARAEREKRTPGAATQTAETTQAAAPPTPAPRTTSQAEPWSALTPLEISARTLDRNRIVSLEGNHPARAAFDILRTRLLRLLKDNNWSRIAITSPSKGAGKTFTSLNLALSLARNPDNRVMLVDLDLRAPGLAKLINWREPKHIERFLSGGIRAEEHFVRFGENLMIGLNTQRVRDSADLIHSEAARINLDETIQRFQPTVVLYDLPPLKAADDAIGVLNFVDGALLLAVSGRTHAREIAEAERLILEHTHLIGVVLNQADDTDTDQYKYY